MFRHKFQDAEYLQIVASNIGAVLMPWMIYFQQSAVVARKLKPKDVGHEKANTLFGSFLTQLVMAATIITFAGSRPKNLEGVQDMDKVLAPIIGGVTSKVMLTF